MSESIPRTTRKVAISDHLWDAFDQMAREMGTERDGLVNQAMFVFARLNGYVESGRATLAAAQTPPAQPRVTGANAPVALRAAAEAAAPVRAAPPAPPTEALFESNEPARAARDVADLDALFDGIKNASEARRSTGPVSIEEIAGPEPRELEATPAAGPHADDKPGLYVQFGSAERLRVDKERFLIGRGKHCDLVIASGKVSREHAVIVRDGETFFIEDLGSSNGTWLNKQRIGRSKIQDGQDYFICAERLHCTLR